MHQMQRAGCYTIGNFFFVFFFSFACRPARSYGDENNMGLMRHGWAGDPGRDVRVNILMVELKCFMVFENCG